MFPPALQIIFFLLYGAIIFLLLIQMNTNYSIEIIHRGYEYNNDDISLILIIGYGYFFLLLPVFKYITVNFDLYTGNIKNNIYTDDFKSIAKMTFFTLFALLIAYDEWFIKGEQYFFTLAKQAFQYHLFFYVLFFLFLRKRLNE